MARSRPHQIKIYLGDRELEQLDQKVNKSKLNQSEFIRKQILEKEIIVIEGLTETLRELKASGNNINQIAKHLNVTDQHVHVSELKAAHLEVLRKIYQVLDQVVK